MAQKPEVQFEKLFQKLYNVELWLLAYQSIAPKPGNMTAGVDGKTIDGAGLKLITDLIADLKASRYTPHPVRRTYVPKANGKLRPLGIPTFLRKSFPPLEIQKRIGSQRRQKQSANAPCEGTVCLWKNTVRVKQPPLASR